MIIPAVPQLYSYYIFTQRSMLDWFKQQKIKTDLVSLQENEDHEVVAIDIQLHATTSIEDLLRLLKGMAGVKGVSIS